MIAAGQEESRSPTNSQGLESATGPRQTRHWANVRNDNDNDDHSLDPARRGAPTTMGTKECGVEEGGEGGEEEEEEEEDEEENEEDEEEEEVLDEGAWRMGFKSTRDHEHQDRPAASAAIGANNYNNNNKEERPKYHHQQTNGSFLDSVPASTSTAFAPAAAAAAAALATSGEDYMTRRERNKWAPSDERRDQQQTSGQLGKHPQLMQIVESAHQKLMMNGLGESGVKRSPRRGRRQLAEVQFNWEPADLEKPADPEPESGGRGGGGATPTNELVRRLLERDRLALARSAGFRDDSEVDPGPKRKSRPLVTGDERVSRPAPPESAGRGADGHLDPKRDKAPLEAEHVGLAALISKCQCIQLSSSTSSPSDTGRKAVHLWHGRPRTPSDPNPVVGVSGSGPNQLQPGRRHSTYMLPLLLADNQRRRAESRSDLGADTGDSSLAGLSSSSSSSSRGSSRSSSSGARSPTSASGSGSPTPPSIRQAQQLSAGGSTSLANSASSPSSLSTPTNQHQLGCGGPCCQAPSGEWLDQGEGRGAPPADSPKRGRLRVGSNPLDRLIGQPSRRRPTANSLRPAREPALKRHSIINILRSSSGAPAATGAPHNSSAAHHLVGRLSSARNFFGAAVSAGQQRSGGRGSIGDCDTPGAPVSCSCSADRKRLGQSQSESAAAGTEHYEPLIPETGFKIVVMGTSGSGKTSIIRRFLYDSFERRHFPTVEDTYFIEFPYMKNMINISISDTSGTYQFPAMRKLAINSGDAFILVYSVDKPESFAELEQLRQTILEEREQAYLEASLLSSCSSSPLCSTNNLASSQALLDSSASSSNSLHSNATSSYSTGDSSRRSSLSPAEAALKTRRTRRPPMVIVANKCDLPQEQHLVNSDEIKALVVIDWNNGFVDASAVLNKNINEIFQQVLKQAKQPPTLGEAIVSKRRRSLPPRLANHLGG